MPMTDYNPFTRWFLLAVTLISLAVMIDAGKALARHPHLTPQQVKVFLRRAELKLESLTQQLPNSAIGKAGVQWLNSANDSSR